MNNPEIARALLDALHRDNHELAWHQPHSPLMGLVGRDSMAELEQMLKAVDEVLPE